MREEGQSIVIIGDGEFAEIACEYFTHDSPHEVVGFAVERAFRKKTELFGKPVVDLEEIEQHFSPKTVRSHVAVTFTQLNRVRARLCQAVKSRGYRPISYISSRAFVWHNVQIGENSFIFENNVIQYHASLGNNVVLWSGNHIGHRAVVRDNCFLSSHVVVSGYCEIGENCFLGVNSAIADKVVIARDCVIGAGAVITRNTEEGKVYRGNREGPASVGSLRLFKVQEAA